jgi:hypothetical protein
MKSTTLRSVVAVGAMTVAIALAGASTAQAKPREATTTCSTITNYEFDAQGNTTTTTYVLCTTRFPDGGIVTITYDNLGDPVEVCHQSRPKSREYCADPNA